MSKPAPTAKPMFGEPGDKGRWAAYHKSLKHANRAQSTSNLEQADYSSSTSYGLSGQAGSSTPALQRRNPRSTTPSQSKSCTTTSGNITLNSQSQQREAVEDSRRTVTPLATPNTSRRIMPFLNSGESKHATQFSSHQNLYQQTTSSYHQSNSFQQTINSSHSISQQHSSQHDLRQRTVSRSEDRDVQKITKSINNTIMSTSSTLIKDEEIIREEVTEEVNKKAAAAKQALSQQNYRNRAQKNVFFRIPNSKHHR